ncbi:unnamed protein product [Menidia menidia]|uniref:(Atlantic silverside) hypothetical protein n=1 Tax=Menidia menidia TaxID=238744 RepID=A0A8S4A5H1_9TELE|nr:unnamed protein product [Menidia menidia]
MSQLNRERIQAIQSSFGPSGKPLFRAARVLVGEGRLLKQSRRGPQPKVFFLFNDLLVYGSIVLDGRWYSRQQIVPLEDILLEDQEDGATMKNQWLICTPRKSFYVAAASPEEKRAWMEHIEDCRALLVRKNSGHDGGGRAPYAAPWIPDGVSGTCMRCRSRRFSAGRRRHHCRSCGLLVCGACSRGRAPVPHIHPTKPLRVCDACRAPAEEPARPRGGSMGKASSDENEEEEEEEGQARPEPGSWPVSWAAAVHLRAKRLRP